MDETLLELKGEGRMPDTVRFLHFSPRAVLVGFHQAVAEEVRVDYCRDNQIDINRRITGGGAIFFDENQLGWEVFCDKSFFNTDIPNAHLFKALCDPVEKLKAKELDSVKERVTCLKWELGHAPTLASIKQAITLGFEKRLDIKLEPGGLTTREQKRFEQKLPHFRSARWADVVKPRFQKREAVQGSYKAPNGMVRFTLVANLPQKRLKDIYITGDFLSFPGRTLYDMEVELRGTPLDPVRLHGIIRDYPLQI